MILKIKKRHQVFVSSTYEDLKEERFSVMQTLLELDCIPAGMELFPASEEKQWNVIERVIDDCDYYIIIIGGMYGSTNKDGISYTELEYRYADEKGIPVISFLIKDPKKLPGYKNEQDFRKKEKLNEFRKVAENKMCKYWESPSDLALKVSTSLHKLKETHPRPGWIKANTETQRTEQVQKEIFFEKATILGIGNLYDSLGNFGTQADWIRLIQNAKNSVNISGRTLYGWTSSNLIKDIIIKKITQEHVEFKWLIMDENNAYLKNLTEEDTGIGDILIQKAKATAKFLNDIKSKLPIDLQDKFCIRYFDSLPLYCSIVNIDDDYYVSNYLYSAPSNESPMIHLVGRNKIWTLVYKKEFESIWNCSK